MSPANKRLWLFFPPQTLASTTHGIETEIRFSAGEMSMRCTNQKRVIVAFALIVAVFVRWQPAEPTPLAQSPPANQCSSVCRTTIRQQCKLPTEPSGKIGKIPWKKLKAFIAFKSFKIKSRKTPICGIQMEFRSLFSAQPFVIFPIFPASSSSACSNTTQNDGKQNVINYRDNSGGRRRTCDGVGPSVGRKGTV